MPLLMPRKYKYRKSHRGRMKGLATRGATLNEGEYGLQALEPAWLTANQLEAARIAINKKMRRQGKIWIRVFPHKPISKKPAETRMGKGKGDTEYWAAVVRPGTIIFEISGVDKTISKEAMRLACYKLPIKTRLVYKNS